VTQIVNLVGGVITNIGGEGGVYNEISNDFLSAIFFSTLAFLFCSASAVFWRIWRTVCAEQNPLRDLPVLVLTPFLSPALVAVLFWNIPIKGEDWNPWLVMLLFVAGTALFTYSFYSIVKKRYRLLSSLGIILAGLATLLVCSIATDIIIGPFMK
jgi:hypothetical protein